MDALAVVEDEVRELVRRRALDPAVDSAVIRRLIDDVVTDYEERSLTSALPGLTDSAIIVSDTARFVRALADFAAAHGRWFAFWAEAPVHHFFVGEGIGARGGRATKRLGERSTNRPGEGDCSRVIGSGSV